MKKLLSVLLIVGVLTTIPSMALAEEELQPGPLSYKYYNGR
jgi:hypothetical protein